MKRQDNQREDKTRTAPRTAKHESEERPAAPPLEREHETYAGIFEEDERREHERQ